MRTEQKLARLRAAAFVMAALGGHVLVSFERDAPSSEVAMCRLCERCASIDAAPDGGINGRAINQACDGVPVTTVAVYCQCLACRIGA